MWVWEQSTGRMTHDTDVSINWHGWAGQDAGRNNPAMQNVSSIGPLPQGYYSIGPSYHHERLGSVTMNLTPDSRNVMYGRADFRIHGASPTDMEHSSHGCIILPRPMRETIDTTSDKSLQVIA